jgi:hypothetical protein
VLPALDPKTPAQKDALAGAKANFAMERPRADRRAAWPYQASDAAAVGPQIAKLAVDLQKDLIQMPALLRIAAHIYQLCRQAREGSDFFDEATITALSSLVPSVRAIAVETKLESKYR